MKRVLAVLLLTVPLFALAGPKPAACKFADVAKLKDHVKTHITYPATGKAVKEACKKEIPDEFSKDEQACVESKIKDKTEYKTPDDVLKALGIPQP